MNSGTCQYTAVTIFTFSFEDMLREDSNISSQSYYKKVKCGKI